MEEDGLDKHIEAALEKELPHKFDKEVKIEIKDYTFGAKLRSQAQTDEKPSKENVLYNTVPQKLDAYMTSKELSKFSIKAFTITKPLASLGINGYGKPADQEISIISRLNQEEDKKGVDSISQSSISKFYNKIKDPKNQELLNNVKMYFDHDVEDLLGTMESHYSLMLNDLLLNHFHLMEYLRIFRFVFFMEREPIYEQFFQEVLLKVNNSSSTEITFL